MTEHGNDETPMVPIYLVVDVSYSMTIGEAGNTPLDAANTVLPKIIDAMAEHPTVRDRLQVSLIDFSGEAEVRLPMVNGIALSTSTDLPALTFRSTGTSYSAAFLTLRHQIESDIETLKAGKRQIGRPSIFFITDGEPTDEPGQPESAWDILTDRGFKARPNVIPFGVGKATHAALDKFGRWPSVADPDRPGSTIEPTAFIMSEISPADAISKIISLLIQSIVGSITDGQNSPVGAVVQLANTAAHNQGDEDDDDEFI
jgi:uncharacterized protein YegL